MWQSINNRNISMGVEVVTLIQMTNFKISYFADMKVLYVLRININLDQSIKINIACQTEALSTVGSID